MRIPVALMIALLTDLIKLDKFLCENIQNDNNQRLIRLGLNKRHVLTLHLKQNNSKGRRCHITDMWKTELR